MSTLRSIAALAFLIALVSCASPRGFDRGELQNDVSGDALVTEEEIQRVIDLKPQLPRPFKLGIYLAHPISRHWGSSWEWRPIDKDAILGVGESLQRTGLVSETIFISPATTQDEELKSVRLAAARHGVDAVLVVSGVSDIDRYNNALGVTYALIVTPLFVPGTVVDGIFVSHAGLWDVRNGFLYASVETDGESSATGPAAFVDEAMVVKDAKKRSIASLTEAIRNHIENLAK
jgi:hypothetical protein